ncbi:hypothetical protein DI392_19285 [Vibrio albus]|uniref:Methyl-accepting chemotaxis protein n=1 Tax=Vibrio albus TaxID=2200953 RepID=A0A2U3B2Y1_9VIBR|nr:methyl-accepting chemotaxis protein [Vibrio albus]PWI31094.1 hypothetical protein DI392_19285 [Vibrio albus]
MNSITKKIVLSISCLCLVFLGLTAFVSFSVEDKITESEYLTVTNRMEGLLSQHLDKKFDIGITNAVGFAANENLQQALATGNRALAVTALSTISDMYKSNTNFKGIKIHLHDKNGISFVRNWDKTKFGEKLTDLRPLVTKVIREKKAVNGFELGNVGLMIRAIAPVIKDGDYLGSIEFLQGVGSISRDMEKNDTTYMLLIDDKYAKKSPKILKNRQFNGYYSVNDNWFSNDVVQKIAQIDVSKLIANNRLITDNCFFISIPATLYDGTVIGHHIIGAPRSIVETGIAQSRQMATLLIVIFGAAFIITIVFILYFLRNMIIKPIKIIGENISIISAGDFSQKVTFSSNDELGELAQSVNNMSQHLSESFQNVLNNSSRLSQLASQLNTDSEVIQSGSKEQCSAVASTITASQQSSITITEVAQNVSSVSSASENATESVSAGSEMTKATYELMSQVGETMEDSSKVIQNLGNSSQKIGTILQVIEDIADQTNLLALNAAIEAARAGEHGRGFSVVADEVRNLAEKTVTATQEISSMIEMIIGEIGNAVTKMEDGVKQVMVGVDTAQQSSESLQGILTNVRTVSADISQIAVAATQQQSAIEVIESNISNIEEVSLKNMNTANETVQRIEILNQVSDELSAIVNQFKLSHI